MIERGLRDVEAGRVVDQDEAKRRMANWLDGIAAARSW
jgi:predicted transcriptional regulator